MTTDVQHHLEARPFEPFTIVTSSGSRYRVARADQANLNPAGSRTVVWFDDESSVTVSGRHLVAIEKDAASNSGGAGTQD